MPLKIEIISSFDILKNVSNKTIDGCHWLPWWGGNLWKSMCSISTVWFQKIFKISFV